MVAGYHRPSAVPPQQAEQADLGLSGWRCGWRAGCAAWGRVPGSPGVCGCCPRCGASASAVVRCPPWGFGAGDVVRVAFRDGPVARRLRGAEVRERAPRALLPWWPWWGRGAVPTGRGCSPWPWGAVRAPVRRSGGAGWWVGRVWATGARRRAGRIHAVSTVPSWGSVRACRSELRERGAESGGRRKKATSNLRVADVDQSTRQDAESSVPRSCDRGLSWTMGLPFRGGRAFSTVLRRDPLFPSQGASTPRTRPNGRAKCRHTGQNGDDRREHHLRGRPTGRAETTCTIDCEGSRFVPPLRRFRRRADGFPGKGVQLLTEHSANFQPLIHRGRRADQHSAPRQHRPAGRPDVARTRHLCTGPHEVN